jgi:hypothetical protein
MFHYYFDYFLQIKEFLPAAVNSQSEYSNQS